MRSGQDPQGFPRSGKLLSPAREGTPESLKSGLDSSVPAVGSPNEPERGSPPRRSGQAMKRIVCLLGLLALVAAPAFAVENLSAGVKAGYNMANMNTDPDASFDARNGLALGGYIGVPISRQFSIQPEALFSMKGAEMPDGSGSVALNYIEVPVLAKASFMPQAKAHPMLFAGPSVAFNLSAKTGDVDVKDNVSPFDMGMVFGGGLDYPLSGGAKSIGIDVRYTLGLTNTDDTGSGADVKNNVLSIMGTLGFL
jgi:hypothetical protein